MPGVVLRELKDRSRGGEKGWYEGGGVLGLWDRGTKEVR